jgi:hypothetical protein
MILKHQKILIWSKKKLKMLSKHKNKQDQIIFILVVGFIGNCHLYFLLLLKLT